MRPVTRGRAPRAYSKYTEAIGDLENRIGIYCSYCERRLPASLAVEHVVPKSLDPKLKTAWRNFLLGCTNCNSVKAKKSTNKKDFVWPDVDNTLRAYTYSAGGFVKVASGLTKAQSAKATNLKDLVGLDRYGLRGHPTPAPRDRRWLQRKDAWDQAQRAKVLLTRLGGSPDACELVLQAAVASGFFSVWMTVFSDSQVIRQGLIAGFKGTAGNCFSGALDAVLRPGGRL